MKKIILVLALAGLISACDRREDASGWCGLGYQSIDEWCASR